MISKSDFYDFVLRLQTAGAWVKKKKTMALSLVSREAIVKFAFAMAMASKADYLTSNKENNGLSFYPLI